MTAVTARRPLQEVHTKSGPNSNASLPHSHVTLPSKTKNSVHIEATKLALEKVKKFFKDFENRPRFPEVDETNKQLHLHESVLINYKRGQPLNAQNLKPEFLKVIGDRLKTYKPCIHTELTWETLLAKKEIEQGSFPNMKELGTQYAALQGKQKEVYLAAIKGMAHAFASKDKDIVSALGNLNLPVTLLQIKGAERLNINLENVDTTALLATSKIMKRFALETAKQFAQDCLVSTEWPKDDLKALASV